MKKTPIKSHFRVASLINQGFSARKIASILRIGHATVDRIRNTVHPIVEVPSKGRPNIITPRQASQIVRSICSGKINTAVDAQKMMLEDYQLVVSAQTIRNMLRKKGLRSRIKKKKPLLKAHHRRQRLEFARKYEQWTLDDWKRVFFSDETKINRMGSDGRKWFWKFPNSSLQDNCVNPTVKFGGGSILIWGCMTAMGVGYMAKIDSKLDAKLYCKILEEDLMNTLEFYGLNSQVAIFQHDNDPKHRAKMTQQWLQNNNINTLDWPAQSPDLNPIEHLWVYLKQRLTARCQTPNSIYELWNAVQEEWNMIDEDFCAKLIKSMPQRINAVIKAKGGHTAY